MQPSHHLQGISTWPTGVASRQDTTRTFGYLGGAVAGLDQDVPSLGAECCCYGFGEGLDAVQKRGAGVDTKLELLQRRIQYKYLELTPPKGVRDKPRTL